jgi:WD40 repeat protein
MSGDNVHGKHGNTLTWQPGDVLFDLYKVRPVAEGLGDAAQEKSCHRGGFGQVYKVYHRGWNLELAMKAPLPGVFENEAQVEDFTRECETWVELGLHPHIVTCYYVRNLSGQPLVFAEYMAGGSLKEWIDSGLLYEGGHNAALKRILDIAIQSARGLHYAHEQGLVHQDVKSANIMLTPEGQAKISDFGTARARARTAAGRVTDSPGTILVSRGGMTPAYCSPEQALGEKLTRRTDIWSWGLTLLEMFTGEVSWASGVAAAQALEAYNNHDSQAEEIPPMPHDLARLLERCFKSEQDRPQNFSQITAELTQIYHESCGLDYPRAEPKAAAYYAGSLNNRALSMHDLGRKEDAEKLWTEALQHDPSNLAATYNLGLIQWRSGRVTDDVLIQRLEGLRQGQPSAQAAYLLAMVHAERLNYLTAVKLLEEAAAESDDYEIGEMLKRLKPLAGEGAECLRTFEGHTNYVSSVCLSADGCYALSGSRDKTLKLWEVKNAKCLRTFEGHTEAVYSASLGADGCYALSGSRDKTLKLWEVKNAKCLRTFEGHTEAVYSACLGSDGCYALAGSSDKTLKLWDVESGRCLRTFAGHTRHVNSVCLSTDNCYALSGSDDTTLKQWEVGSRICLRTFRGHTGRVISACLSADNRYALSGSYDRTLNLWDVESGRCLHTFEGHKGIVISVYLSADGCYALSGSSDKTIKLWEIKSGRCLHTFKGHNDWVTSVCLSADNRYALSGSWDKTLKLWRVPWPVSEDNLFAAELEASQAVKTEVVLSAEAVFNMYLTKANRALQAGDVNLALLALQSARAQPGRLRDRQLINLWVKLYQYLNRSRYMDGWLLCTFEGHNYGVTSVCLSADNRYALSGSWDATLKLWEVESGKCLRTFKGHADGVSSVSLSADGRLALSGSRDSTLKLWEVESGKCLRTFEEHASDVESVSLSADGRLVLSGSSDSKLKLWEVNSGKCLRTFKGHMGDCFSGGFHSVCLNADGRLALTGSEWGSRSQDTTLKLWELERGKCLRIFEGHASTVTSVSLSADGRLALSGSRDKTIKLWEVESGRCLRTFEGHTDGVKSVCLSADCRFALSGGGDSKLKLWEVNNGKCLHTFEEHMSDVESVSLSADGRYALSGSTDKTLRLWELYWELEPH